MKKVFKSSLAAFVVLSTLIGCTQGPELAKLDERGMNQYNSRVELKAYSFSESNLERWIEEAKEFEAMYEQLMTKGDLEFANKLIEQMNLVELVQDVNEYDFEKEKTEIISQFNADRAVLKANLHHSEGLLEDFMPTYTKSLNAYNKATQERKELTDKEKVYTDNFESAIAKVIDTLAEVNVKDDVKKWGSIARHLNTKNSYKVYSFDYTAGEPVNSCKSYSPRNAERKVYSDPVIHEGKLYCSEIYFSNSQKDFSQLGTKQLAAIKEAAGRSYEYIVLRGVIVKAYNNYYKDNYDLKRVVDRHPRGNARKFENLQEKVKKDEVALANFIVPSEVEIISSIEKKRINLAQEYSKFHINNLLVEQLDFVSDISSDGRFRLDNSEQYNLLLVKEKDEINQRARVNVIRLAEYAEDTVATIETKHSIDLEDLMSFKL